MTKDKLHTIPCPKCGAEAKEVVYAEQKLRRGWYCKKCSTFTAAILRERQVEDNQK